jgi:hypothetical protein
MCDAIALLGKFLIKVPELGMSLISTPHLGIL